MELPGRWEESSRTASGEESEVTTGLVSLFFAEREEVQQRVLVSLKGSLWLLSDGQLWGRESGSRWPFEEIEVQRILL